MSCRLVRMLQEACVKGVEKGTKRIEKREKEKVETAYVEALFAQFFFSHLAGLMRKPSTS